MRTLSREFLSMTTSTLSVSWFDGINPPCAVCSVNLLERTSLWRTIWRNKHSCAHIKTFAAFAVKHASQHGFIESRTIVFEKMRAAGRNLWESTKNNSKRNTILRSPILL